MSILNLTKSGGITLFLWLFHCQKLVERLVKFVELFVELFVVLGPFCGNPVCRDVRTQTYANFKFLNLFFQVVPAGRE